MRKSIAVVGLVALVAAGLTWRAAGAGPQQAVELVSTYTAAPPRVDGSPDATWESVSGISFPVVGGANTGSHDVTVKSVYTNTDVYFLVRWTDPTQNMRRSPWQKQADGSWLQLTDGAPGDNNLYYEDKLAFIWNINNSIAGFNQAGCMVTCHAGEAGKAYGNKYTAGAGQRGDIWHWKSVRTGPVGLVDDQWLDDVRYSTEKPEAGRHSDPKTSGGYADNVNADKSGPAFMGPQGAKGPYWILDSEKQPFSDTFQAGDEIPGIIIAPIAGDRGDIEAWSEYAGGGYTLEIRRALVTGSEFDVQFDDAAAVYHFGMAVFDNAQVRHSFETGPSALRFAPRPTAVAQYSWGEVKSQLGR